MHVYIAPKPGHPVLRRCTVLLSLTQTCFHPAHISTPKGAYNTCCHYRRKALLKHIAITSCQVLIFMDEWISPHMTTLRPPKIRTFGYESYALTNCAITARWEVNKFFNLKLSSWSSFFKDHSFWILTHIVMFGKNRVSQWGRFVFIGSGVLVEWKLYFSEKLCVM